MKSHNGSLSICICHLMENFTVKMSCDLRKKMMTVILFLFFINSSFAQVSFCAGPTTCASSGNTCFIKLSSGGTGCGLVANGACVEFYSVAGGGSNCQPNIRDNCNCIDLTKGFTWTADLFFGSNLAAGVGDGFAFVLKPDVNNSGGTGGYIGYGNLTGNWVASEFDDFQNLPGDDPACQHTATYQSGSATAIAGPTCLGAAGLDVRNTSSITYAVKVVWDPVAKTLSTYFNGVLKTTATIDLAAKFAGTTCLTAGLSSATGGLPQDQKACNISLVVTTPVTLLNFEGELSSQNKVLLNWSTAQEINNKEFTVSRSVDAQNWETIAILPGAGNSSSILNYSFTDITAPLVSSEFIYYKLVQTDIDGKSESFPPISVDVPNEDMIQVIPNPGNGQFKLLFGNSALDKYAVYKIYSIQGQEVFPASIQTIENTAILDAGNLNSGIYYLNFIANGKVFNEKIIIAR
jgi:hypothetical protein